LQIDKKCLSDNYGVTGVRMDIQYTPNLQKIIESILWFAKRSQRTDIHSILKELYYSDKIHLQKYGRPVTGDTYIKMDYGPVASYAYDFLKVSRLSDYTRRQRYTPDVLEEAIRAIDASDPYKIRPLRLPDIDYFSETDLECMKEALGRCNGKSFEELVEITHREKSWQAATMDKEMNFEDFLDDISDKEARLEYIKESAPCLSF
jgi:uncharacterized phage-associated protein